MESNQSNAAAVRAFRVLEVVAQHRDGCALAAIVEAVGLPKQTVHRLVGQLQLAGLVVKEPGTRRVQLATRVERFAQAALMNGPARAERHAILAALVAEIGETCNLAALAGTDIVYLDRVETSWPLRMLLAPGSHVPLHASASGKLLLALLPLAAAKAPARADHAARVHGEHPRRPARARARPRGHARPPRRHQPRGAPGGHVRHRRAGDARPPPRLRRGGPAGARGARDHRRPHGPRAAPRGRRRAHREDLRGDGGLTHASRIPSETAAQQRAA